MKAQKKEKLYAEIGVNDITVYESRKTVDLKVTYKHILLMYLISQP